MDFGCKDVSVWKEALSTYTSQIQSLSLSKNKSNLVSLNQFYCNELPSLIHQRNPNPFITTEELSKLMQWKLTRGKWRLITHSLTPFILFYFIFCYRNNLYLRVCAISCLSNRALLKVLFAF